MKRGKDCKFDKDVLFGWKMENEESERCEGVWMRTLGYSIDN